MNIGIIGVGAVGLYVGGSLLHRGFNVTFVGRKAVFDDLQHRGKLTLSDKKTNPISVPLNRIHFEYEVNSKIAECEVLIVTAKCFESEGIAQELATIKFTSSNGKSITKNSY